VDDQDADDLQDCHETVEQLLGEKEALEEENVQLRESAGAFGELAERLNVALAEERQGAGAGVGKAVPGSAEPGTESPAAADPAADTATPTPAAPNQTSDPEE
jgi:hypothetical protein